MRLKQLLVMFAGLCFAVAAQGKPPALAPIPVVPALTPENTLLLDLSSGGRVTVQLRPDKAPRTVERIRLLARRGFYDGLIFHRVIEGFMAQTGDPKGTGEGGSELPDLKAEFNDLPHVRGTVSAARASDDDSANSQFFIMFQPNLRLDNRYSAFGRVVAGMTFVDAIARGEPPANPTRIVKATIGGDPERAPIPQPAVPPEQPKAAAEPVGPSDAEAAAAPAAPTDPVPPTTSESKAERKAKAKEARAAEKARAREAKDAAEAAKEADKAAAKATKKADKAAARAAKAKASEPAAPGADAAPAAPPPPADAPAAEAPAAPQ